MSHLMQNFKFASCQLLATQQQSINCMYLSDGCPDDHSSELVEALQRVREQLHSTRSSAAVCLICLENMHNDDAVWHCYRGCCCVLHLVCIQAWSRQQVAAATYTASPDPSRCSSVQKHYQPCVLAHDATASHEHVLLLQRGSWAS